MNLFICQTIAIGCGYILDLLIGDPHWLLIVLNSRLSTSHSLFSK